MVVVLADHLGEHVERARRHDDVVDLVHLGQRVGLTGPAPAVHAHADQGLPGEAHLQRVGDRDDLHDAGLQQPLHALPHRGLRQAHGLGDRPRTAGGRPPGAAR